MSSINQIFSTVGHCNNTDFSDVTLIAGKRACGIPNTEFTQHQKFLFDPTTIIQPVVTLY